MEVGSYFKNLSHIGYFNSPHTAISRPINVVAILISLYTISRAYINLPTISTVCTHYRAILREIQYSRDINYYTLHIHVYVRHSIKFSTHLESTITKKG